MVEASSPAFYTQPTEKAMDFASTWNPNTPLDLKNLPMLYAPRGDVLTDVLYVGKNTLKLMWEGVNT
jgi:hypothetical protein